MLKFIARAGCDIKAYREKYANFLRFQFDSSRKRMSTVIELPSGVSTDHGYSKRLMIKGASEIILDTCTHYLDANG
jgi:Ca2+-transporting ATPase